MTSHPTIKTALPSAVDMALFDALETAPPVSLAARFVVPPFSVIDRRTGDWNTRKQKWLSLGIESEKGREELLTYTTDRGSEGWREKAAGRAPSTSVFDPVLCELAYRWFTNEGDAVLDPFAGGSVRGVVASSLARRYVGIELRPEQVEANRAQAHLGSSLTPEWIEGDARRAADLVGDAEFDLVFTCPPYADLEVYSDDPRDLSNMPYDRFLEGYGLAIAGAARHLRRDRYFIVVISDVRDRTGNYRGLVSDTVKVAQSAGLHLYNDLIALDRTTTAALRATAAFRNRKVVRAHQHMLVFVKGDGKAAARRLNTESP